jgi:hypothetical protein
MQSANKQRIMVLQAVMSSTMMCLTSVCVSVCLSTSHCSRWAGCTVLGWRAYAYTSILPNSTVYLVDQALPRSRDPRSTNLLGHQVSVAFLTSLVATESLRPSQRPLVFSWQLASVVFLLVVGPVHWKMTTDCLPVVRPPWLMPDTYFTCEAQPGRKGPGRVVSGCPTDPINASTAAIIMLAWWRSTAPLVVRQRQCTHSRHGQCKFR